MKTGQTTSFQTGDDGDLQEGRATDFLTLEYNNPFGNTNRFTDELGGTTYANDIVIDWSTYDTVSGKVLGWYRTPLIGTLSAAISNSLAFSVGTFTSGWFLPNIIQLISIANYGVAQPLNYAPFNQTSNNFWWCSTTQNSASSFAYLLANGTAFVGSLVYGFKVNTYAYYPCRTFTVTGTTLT